VPGIPATFATKGEIPWRKALECSICSIPTLSNENFGFDLKFILPTLAPNNQPLDIDNLCEPVFSVLINKLGWFGGKRPNIKWWRAMKICGQPSGLQLSAETRIPLEMTRLFENLLFDGVYEGELPRRATDNQIPSWINSLKEFESPQNSDRFVIHLQFGGLKLNIGNIATGEVKSIIDCLYPVIGGLKGKPEDWRVDVLQVEKGATNLNDSVRISIWNVSTQSNGGII
jgi:hypothetical protein